MEPHDIVEQTNHLFTLGWLIRPDTAPLRHLQQALEQCDKKNLTENDTLALFVETVLRGLGWDTLDINQVNRENPRGEHIVGDMHLLTVEAGRRRIRGVIEAKNLDCPDGKLESFLHQLDRYVNKLLGAAKGYNAGVRPEPVHGWFLRGVLTNGRAWFVYDFKPSPNPTDSQIAMGTPAGKFWLPSMTERGEVDRFVGLLSRRAILQITA
jgi:hypothetical protein